MGLNSLTKGLALSAALVLGLSLTACSSKEKKADEAPPAAAASPAPEAKAEQCPMAKPGESCPHHDHKNMKAEDCPAMKEGGTCPHHKPEAKAEGKKKKGKKGSK